MASGSRTVVDDEVSQLLHAMPRRELDAEERQRLLERLTLLERLEDAKLVLQQWLNQQPHSLPLGLLMAELQLRSGALEAARQHLYPLLRLHPVNPERLQLKPLVDLQDGLGHEALQRVTTHFAARPGGSVWTWDCCWSICMVSSACSMRLLMCIGNWRRNQART